MQMEKDLASLRSIVPGGAVPTHGLPTSYPIAVWDTKPALENLDLGGVTYVSGADFMQLTPSLRVSSTLVVDRMFVLNTGDRRRTLYHFLHELAHTVTLPELHKAGSLSAFGIDSRFQPLAQAEIDGYVPNHHPVAFYQNLALLLRTARQMKVWTPPSDFPGFRPRDLHRYDTFTVA
jgi:hypothetical protein